jgi:hypothetical protein
VAIKQGASRCFATVKSMQEVSSINATQIFVHAKGLWPLTLIVVGLLLIGAGFIVGQLASIGYSPYTYTREMLARDLRYQNVGVAICYVGLGTFAIGLIGGIVRWIIRRHLVLQSICALTIVIVTLFAVHRYRSSFTYIRAAQEAPYDLWIRALKPFEGPPYYVGSEGEYSYFRAGFVFVDRYKVQTEKTRLPRTFPLGHGEPYIVTAEMVPQY